MELDKLITRYMQGLENDFKSRGFTLVKKWLAEPGKRYIKISSGYLEDDGEISQRSVDAFIDKATGDVYKPASWKAPAKGVRFNLFKDIDYLEKNCGGGHLYR
jgi:hypothetical protein